MSNSTYYQQAILFGLSIAFTFAQACQVKAQLIPDNTLGKENSQINSINALEEKIDGGAIRGSNLFHSFKEFNVDNNRSVYFNNPASIQNILTRVTGNNQSKIFGKLGVLGNANLFLINPKGIIFGKGASLDINGSFVGSSASFINFADGTNFSAVSPDKPLLTISAPLGLGMGLNPGEIRVQGDGNKFSGNGLEIPFIDITTKGLEVAPEKTIALIGGNIILEGGLLKTKSGKIELGSVGSGKVDFSFTPELNLNYSKVKIFQDIQLSQKALLNATSHSEKKLIGEIMNSHSIHLYGKIISLSTGSFINLANQTELPAGNININATESFQIGSSSIRSQALLAGQGGDIEVSTKQLFMQDKAIINVSNYGYNSGGNIEIKASDSIDIIGSAFLGKAPTSIAINAFNSGNGGNIDVSTNHLKVLDGGIISSTTFTSGDAGNLTINARESIEVSGISPDFIQPSVLTSLTLGSGNSGNLTVNTQRLTVKNGGRVDASTIGSGAAGSIAINAAEKVELAGFSPEVSIPSQITSSANIADESIQFIFGISDRPTGESGAITINTNQLNITDSALFAVKNDGSGNAGKLQVKADSININNQGSISATTTLGGGGDIDLYTQNLILRRNSNITATAGAGDGGNINIDAQILAALENSDIKANSESSFGGKVTINAKGVFGTQFRESLTPESDITATSGKGAEFNGVVDINTIAIDAHSGLVELPKNLIDTNQKIVAGCSANRGTNFTIVGHGGLPENPHQLFTGNTPTVDLLDLNTISENQQNSNSSTSSISNNKLADNSINQNRKEIVEAKGWIVDTEGNIEFVAEVPQMKNSEGIRVPNCELLSSN